MPELPDLWVRCNPPRLVQRDTLPLTMSWELDIWGKIRHQVESTTASSQASEAQLAAVRLSAQSQLAQNYFQIRFLDGQKKLLDTTIAAYQRTLDLTKNRYAGGVASKGDVLQAETQLKTVQAQAIDIGVQRAQLEHASALLCGKPASSFSIPEQTINTEYGDLGDLLEVDARAVQDDTLYRCLDLLLPLKEELFGHLRQRWCDLFGATYQILLYDLTSTYFECDVPEGDEDPRRFGYSRDKRGDCVQVVVALVVTPEGLPLAYEMFPGNTADKTTLRGMIETIQRRFGKAERIWIMDRGIPTEEVLTELRAADPKVRYLVGTPKGRLTKLESTLAELPWSEVRPQLRVKLLPQDGEVYVLAHSGAREGKERGMRKRRLKAYWKRLADLQKQAPPRDLLLKKLGAAQDRAGRVATGLVHAEVSAEGILSYQLDRAALRAVRQREGRYLLRTNLAADEPELIWHCYMQLVFVEEAFRTLKNDLGLRPIYHHKPERIEAHLFVAFLAYCLSITLRQQLRGLAPGLMPRVVFEKLATLQMLDVIVPTTDDRELLLVRRTEPDRDVALLLDRLGRSLPAQPPPKIRTPIPRPL